MVSVTGFQIGMFILSMIGTVIAIVTVMGRVIDRWLTERFSSLNERIDQMQKSYQADVSALQRVERDLLMLRAELPERYVRREDHIRSQTVIEAKLDALCARIDRQRGD